MLRRAKRAERKLLECAPRAALVGELFRIGASGSRKTAANTKGKRSNFSAQHALPPIRFHSSDLGDANSQAAASYPPGSNRRTPIHRQRAEDRHERCHGRLHPFSGSGRRPQFVHGKSGGWSGGKLRRRGRRLYLAFPILSLHVARVFGSKYHASKRWISIFGAVGGRWRNAVALGAKSSYQTRSLGCRGRKLDCGYSLGEAQSIGSPTGVTLTEAPGSEQRKT